jgi:hypothetical protein
LVFPCAASALTILPLSTTRLILQPDAQYGQTVTTFFIGLAPVNQFTLSRFHTDYASSMPCFYCGYPLILRVSFGRCHDEKQILVRFDVSKWVAVATFLEMITRADKVIIDGADGFENPPLHALLAIHYREISPASRLTL